MLKFFNKSKIKTVLILKAVSGSGKTLFANTLKQLYPGTVIVSADDYFYDNDGNYNFCVAGLGAAHGACRRKFKEAVDNGAELVIVSNTNVEQSHWKYYEDYGKENGYIVHFLIIENRAGSVNKHFLPQETLEKQRKKILNSIKL